MGPYARPMAPPPRIPGHLPQEPPKADFDQQKHYYFMLYAGVFRGGDPLVDHGSDAKARTFAKAVAVTATQSKFSYTSDSMAGHGSRRSNGDIVLVVCDSGRPRRRVFALVEQIEHQIKGADDKQALGDLVDGFDWNDPLAGAQADIDQVRTIMIENVDRVLERGERISLLVDRTQELSSGAHTFRKQAVAARNRIWWRNVRMICLLVAFVAMFALVVYLFF